MMPNLNFWKKGMRFSCVSGCRKCCEIPGLVFVHKSEIRRIAAFLGKTSKEFKQNSLKLYWGDVYYLDYPESEPCMFVSDEGCAIYKVRPLQCASFPFWPDNMRDRKIWNSLKKICPGMEKGELHSHDEILEILTTVALKLEI